MINLNTTYAIGVYSKGGTFNGHVCAKQNRKDLFLTTSNTPKVYKTLKWVEKLAKSLTFRHPDLIFKVVEYNEGVSNE